QQRRAGCRRRLRPVARARRRHRQYQPAAPLMLRLLTLAAVLGLLSPWLVALLAEHSQHLAWLFDLASHWQWLHVALLAVCLALLGRRQPRWWLLLPLAALP